MAYGNKVLKAFYDQTPLFIKNIFSSFYGLRQRRERYGNTYYHHLEFLRESQYWSNNDLIKFQNERLSEFLDRSLSSVPYYIKEYGRPKINTSDELHKLPILDKKTLKLHVHEFYNLKNQSFRWSHTSGTTGSSLIFPISKDCFQKEYAFRGLHYEWGGIRFHGRDKIAVCAGHPVSGYKQKKPPYWVYDFANNWLLFSSYHMTETNLKYYIREIENFQPLMIYGYPSSVYLLALAYRKFGRQKLNLRSIYTSSETLLTNQKATIEEIFGVKVFNWYGTSEMTTNIVECEHGELHLKLEHSITEILNQNNDPCQPGETGRIIATNFSNYTFPLIRYDIGDIITISKNQNSRCGRGGILIDNIQGRIEDYIFTPDGRIVGRLDHIFKDTGNVIEAQIEQIQLKELILRIVRNSQYTNQDEKQILQEARVRLGPEIKILFEYPERIERSINGKFRFIISRLNSIDIPL